MKPSYRKQQEKILTNLAIVIALIVSVSLPIAYSVVSYQGLSYSLSLKAKIKADAQTDVISALPDTWMYAENRIHGLLEREPIRLDNEFIELFDSEGHLVVSTGKEIKRWKIQRSYPLQDIHQVVGKITVSASLINLYISVFLVSILSFSLGFLVFLILRLLPIRTLKRISDELYLEKERAEVTLNSIHEAILVCDKDGYLLYFNAFAEKMFGKVLITLRGKNFSEYLQIIDKESQQQIESTLTRTLKSKKTSKCNKKSLILTEDKVVIEVEERTTPVFNKEGELTTAVLCLQDVTIVRKDLELKTWEASHDTLTGLVNRSEFERRIADAIQTMKETELNYVVCYLDLDHFKVINDACGHHAGDALLKQLTQCMSYEISENDTLARLGGDEFGLLLEDCNEEKGLRIVNRLLTIIKQFQFFWENNSYSIGVSIGFTIIKEDSSCLTEVLGQADAACYWAKDQGRNRVCVFKESDQDLAIRRGETDWVRKINTALKENKFVLYHQTYKSLNNRKPEQLHLEILLRMLSEEGRVITPNNFFPAAERYDLVEEIDKWVINKTFSEYKWIESLYPNKELMISINLSGGSINSSDLLNYIKEKIAEFNIDARKFCFEITETVAVKDIRAAIEFITECKKLGAKFALDDFGTGTSSFGYLKQLSVDYLKIDGSFVKNIEHDPIDKAMTETINKIGHIMEKVTVAEFAENESIIGILEDIGVDYAQGYGVCLPIPIRQLKDQ